MTKGKLTLADVKRRIRKCDKKNVRYDWLGFVENQDLTNEVESLFTFINYHGATAYDWVNGNNKLKTLIQSLAKAEKYPF